MQHGFNVCMAREIVKEVNEVVGSFGIKYF